ncbi:hypothetical protein GQR58_018148 [Nymphon striatum]|nr:hypothetical protein GQR58_018148 [Nymphon striatum]
MHLSTKCTKHSNLTCLQNIWEPRDAQKGTEFLVGCQENFAHNTYFLVNLSNFCRQQCRMAQVIYIASNVWNRQKTCDEVEGSALIELYISFVNRTKTLDSFIVRQHERERGFSSMNKFKTDRKTKIGQKTTEVYSIRMQSSAADFGPDPLIEYFLSKGPWHIRIITQAQQSTNKSASSGNVSTTTCQALNIPPDLGDIQNEIVSNEEDSDNGPQSQVEELLRPTPSPSSTSINDIIVLNKDKIVLVIFIDDFVNMMSLDNETIKKNSSIGSFSNETVGSKTNGSINIETISNTSRTWKDVLVGSQSKAPNISNVKNGKNVERAIVNTAITASSSTSDLKTADCDANVGKIYPLNFDGGFISYTSDGQNKRIEFITEVVFINGMPIKNSWTDINVSFVNFEATTISSSSYINNEKYAATLVWNGVRPTAVKTKEEIIQMYEKNLTKLICNGIDDGVDLTQNGVKLVIKYLEYLKYLKLSFYKILSLWQDSVKSSVTFIMVSLVVVRLPLRHNKLERIRIKDSFVRIQTELIENALHPAKFSSDPVQTACEVVQTTSAAETFEISEKLQNIQFDDESKKKQFI